MTLKYKDENGVSHSFYPVTGQTTYTLFLQPPTQRRRIYVYEIWLHAKNADGEASDKVRVDFVLSRSNHGGLPAKITDLTPTVDGKDVTLNWKFSPEFGPSYPSALTLTYQKNDGTKERIELNNFQTSYDLKNLPIGKYTFQLFHKNFNFPGAREFFSGSTTATVRHENTPKIHTFDADFIADPIVEKQVKLDWVLEGGAPTSLTLRYQKVGATPWVTVTLDHTRSSGSHTLTTPGWGEYVFKLIAENANALAGSDFEVSDTETVTVTLLPIIDDLNGSADLRGNVTLTWDLKGGDPTSLTLGYNDGSEQSVDFPSPTTTSHTLFVDPDLGLTKFTLTAVNDATGPSGVRETKDIMIADVLPPKISVFTPDVLGDNKVKLDWVLGGGQAEELWLIYYSDSSEESDPDTDTKAEVEVTGKTSYTIPFLPHGPATFTLIALNAAAPDTERDSDSGVRSTKKETVESVARPIIDGFIPTVLGENKVRLDWLLVGGTPTSLLLSYSKDGSNAVTSSDDIPPVETSYTFPDLEPGKYFFTLVAVNAAAPQGKVMEVRSVIVTDVARPIIEKFDAVPLDQKKVRLDWRLLGGETTELTVGYSSSEGWQSVTLDPTQTSHTLSDLEPVETTFTLHAVNAAASWGKVRESDTVTVAEIAPPIIDDFDAVPIGPNKVRLVWKLDGGETIKLTASYNDGSEKIVPIVDLTRTSIEVVTAKPGLNTFTLIAENTAAPAPNVKDTKTVTVDGVLPPEIIRFDPTVLGENKVLLEWKLDGGKAEELRLMYYPGDRAYTMEELGDRVDAIVEKDVTGETSYTFSDLPSGLGTFTLIAVNDAAPDTEGPDLAVSSSRTITVESVARPIISVFNPEVLGENKVKLEWKLDGGKAEQLRLIYYPGDRADSNEELGDRVDAIVEEDVTGETSYTFSDLPSGLGTFMLIAVNDAAPDTGLDLAVISTRTITVESVARPIIYDFQAESIGDKKVKLTWTLGGGEATKLKVRYSDGSGGSLDADGTNKSADVTHKMSKRSHTLENFKPGRHTFVLHAENAAAGAGKVHKFDYEEVVLEAPKISYFKAVPLGSNKVRLEWKLRGGDPTTLTLFHKNHLDPTSKVNVHPLEDLTETSYTFSELPLGPRTFGLHAENGVDPSDEEIDTVDVEDVVPPIILDFKAVPIGEKKVELNWKLDGSAPTKLSLRYQKEGEDVKEVPLPSPTQTSYTLPLSEKGEYTFWLVAVNIAAPKGVRSDPDTAIVEDVAPPTISNFKAIQTTSKEKEVTLNWALGGGQVSKLTLVYMEGDELENFPVPIKDLTKTSHTLTLSKKGKYTFWLVAANDGAPTGVSSDTKEVIVVDVVPPTISNFKATRPAIRESNSPGNSATALALRQVCRCTTTMAPTMAPMRRKSPSRILPRPATRSTTWRSWSSYTFWLVAVNAAPTDGVSNTETVDVEKVDPPTIGKLRSHPDHLERERSHPELGIRELGIQRRRSDKADAVLDIKDSDENVGPSRRSHPDQPHDHQIGAGQFGAGQIGFGQVHLLH